MTRFRILAGLLCALLIVMLTPPPRALAVGDLEITQTAAPDPVAVGQELTWTLTVRNLGDEIVNSVEVNDNFNEYGTTNEFVSVTPSRGSCTNAANTFNCQLGTLNPGASETIRLVVRVLKDGAIITKTGTPATAGNGDRVSYRLRVTNNGPSTARSAVVTDELPDGLSYDAGSCAADQGDCAASGDTITFELGAIGVGDSVELRFTATVDDDAPDGVLTNRAAVGHAGDDPVESNDEAEHRLNVDGAADVAITKTAAPAVAVAGGPITFTIVATNNGPGTATDLDLSDRVPAQVAVTGVTASAGSCDSGTSNAVHCTLGTLAPEGTWTVTVTGRLAPEAAVGLLRNTATVTVPDDPTESNNTATAIVPVRARADLTIAKSAPATVLAGERLDYRITVGNDGPSTARQVVVVDQLPPGTTFVRGGNGTVDCAAEGAPAVVRPSAGSCTETAGTITCERATLPAGATWVIIVRVAVAASASGSLTNTATASADTTDPEPGNNTGSVTAEVQVSADLVMIKWALFRKLGAGGTAVFFLTVVNTGPSAATEVNVSDTFPAELTPTAVTNPGCSLDAQVVSCSYPAVGAGESRTAMVTAKVADDAAGKVVNTADVTASTPDPVTANNTDQAAITVVPVADLGLTKSADPTEAAPGDEVIFALVATNAGPSAAGEVTLSDELPAGLTVRSVQAGAPFVCETADRRVTCAAETLAVGEYPIAVTAEVADAASGTLVNTARVTAETVDPNPDDNEASATLTVTDGGDGGELPQTGGGSWPLGYLIGALVLTASGAALLVAGRRRQT